MIEKCAYTSLNEKREKEKGGGREREKKEGERERERERREEREYKRQKSHDTRQNEVFREGMHEEEVCECVYLCA